ncbi:DnaJ-domain-containing protein [Pseudohyphozyma bogoriensis]|nr:DnaJ-domain-containing protein [Pseudohyphozyma bogoriensis]
MPIPSKASLIRADIDLIHSRREQITEAREVLGLSESYTAEEAKASYKKLALRCHPDRNGNSEEATTEFQRVGAAFQKANDHLKNPHGDRMPFGGGGGGPFGPGAGFTYSPYGGFSFHFGGGGGRRGPSYGASYDEEEEYPDGDDYTDEEGYSDEDEDEDDDPAADFFDFLFANIFAGGSGSRREYSGYRQQHEHNHSGFGYRYDDETDEERKERLAKARADAIKAEEKRLAEERHRKEEKIRLREEEMRAGAARREKKAADKKSAHATHSAGAAKRAVDLLTASQTKRSAVFAAARAGDWAKVKAGIWEESVAASDPEFLPGFVRSFPPPPPPTTQQKPAPPPPAQRPTPQPQTNGAGKGKGKGRGKGKKRDSNKENQPEVPLPRPPVGSPGDPSGKAKKKKKKKGGAGGGGGGADAGAGGAANGHASPKSPQRPLPQPSVKESEPIKLSVGETETLLHIVAKAGNAELLEWLIDQGAAPEERDSAGFSPFHYALQSGHEDVISYFLTNFTPPKTPISLSQSTDSPDPSYPTPPGETLLSLAVSSASAKSVSLIAPYSTVEDSWDQWCWIEDLLADLGTSNTGEKEIWEDVKWALTEVKDFPAAAVGYTKRNKRR